MHAEFAAQTGADTAYVPFRVRPEDLPRALDSITALSIRGVNITVPHKEAVYAALDHLEPAAQAIGAVNTVTNQDGKLVGDNTDARGFLADLRHCFPQNAWENYPALVVGAGGAARAVVYALGETAIPSIRVANRTEAKARALVEEMCPDRGKSLDLSEERIDQAVAESRLIINTTSLGLKGETVPGLHLEKASRNAVVYDLIYNPAETPLLKQARSRGLDGTNGLGMLVRQGAISFEIWTGLQPSVDPVTRMLAETTKS
jgi:shikimate dehydrogenase